jgi:hypothetical protein
MSSSNIGQIDAEWIEIYLKSMKSNPDVTEAIYTYCKDLETKLDMERATTYNLRRKWTKLKRIWNSKVKTISN